MIRDRFRANTGLEYFCQACNYTEDFNNSDLLNNNCPECKKRLIDSVMIIRVKGEG